MITFLAVLSFLVLDQGHLCDAAAIDTLAKIMGRDAASCTSGAYKSTPENWMSNDGNNFLRHWWFCANGTLTGDTCKPGNNASANAGANTTQDSGLSLNITLDINPLSINISSAGDGNATGSTNTTTPLPGNPGAAKGLTSTLVNQYAPSVDTFNCDVHHDCAIASCNVLDFKQDDNLRAYLALISIGNINDAFKQTYDVINEVQLKIVSNSAQIAKDLTEGGHPPDENNWKVLETLNNVLVGVAVLMFNFVPEFAGLVAGTRLARTVTLEYRAAANVGRSGGTLAGARTGARNLAANLASGTAAWRQIGQNVVTAQNRLRQIEEKIAANPPVQTTNAWGAVTYTESDTLTNLKKAQTDQIAKVNRLLAAEEKARAGSGDAAAAAADADPGLVSITIPRPTAGAKAIDTIGKLNGLIPSIAGSVAFALNKGTSTITIDSLANFGSLTDIGTSSLKDWFAEENDALLKGLNDSNGYYIWDYMEDGHYTAPGIDKFDGFKTSLYTYFQNMLINAAITINHSFITGYKRNLGNGTTVTCEQILATKFQPRQFGGPWQTFWCDDKFPYWFHMYKIPSVDPLGIIQQRLALPDGLENLGVSSTGTGDRSKMPYGVSVQDIINSSVNAHFAMRQGNATDYGAIRMDRWLGGIEQNSATPIADAPSIEGVFDVPVCLSTEDHATPVYDWWHRWWPCTCGTNGNETYIFQRNIFVQGFEGTCYNQLNPPKVQY